jgi:hypothetical protein
MSEAYRPKTLLLGPSSSPRGSSTAATQDGSWVALSKGKLYFGFNGQVFDAQPKPTTSAKTYSSLPSMAWQWFVNNTALGNTPVIGSNAQCAQTLPALGYLKKNKGGAVVWEHPDGSYFQEGTYAPVPGFQKWHIGQLPYNNRIPNP